MFLKYYHLWTQCKSPFVCYVVFLVLVPLIVILPPADKEDLFHLWKNLKARTAFSLTANYLLYRVSSVSQSCLIVLSLYLPIFNWWESLLPFSKWQYSVIVGVSFDIVGLFFRNPCFFKLFELGFLFSRAGNVIQKANWKKKLILYLPYVSII